MEGRKRGDLSIRMGEEEEEREQRAVKREQGKDKMRGRERSKFESLLPRVSVVSVCV